MSPPSPDSTTGPGDPTTTREGNALDDLLPEATVDSKWWYWIAAVPAYFVLTLLFGGAAFFLVLAGVGIDLLGGLGVATFGVTALLVVFAFLVALPGLLLAVLFPVAIYVDARAVERAALDWRPDPVLYGLVAVVGVVATNFVVSVPLACYYLYKRHEAVGTP
ncbi:hypothetical protein ACFO0N_17130 [Halobium salinum]|uniref:Uncharacterized protein n=1 Tax=Halobium salinum TaxID=1364940 RepID=A0ABD5PFK0_9EURY|nr:hypothetical protein [Halobium salinum]